MEKSAETKITKQMEETLIDDYLNPKTDLYEHVYNIPAGKDFNKTIKDLAYFFFGREFDSTALLKHLKKQEKIDKATGAIIVMSMNFIDVFGPSIDKSYNKIIYKKLSHFEKTNQRAYTNEQSPAWIKKIKAVAKELNQLTERTR